MKKKFYGALMLGSLFLAGGMVSCCDYDDDINSLNERVDALEKTVAELQKAIEAGAVITNVENTENGVKVTLSDGKTFEVKNGTNGADGQPGSVVEIREVDGVAYWFIDEKNTGYPVKGEKGEAGKPGQPGEPGADGKDGCWYEPNADGFWHKMTPQEDGTVKDEKTEQAWVPSAEESVRVVYDTENGCLLISNAEGMEEGQVITIPITSDLKSLAVIPYVWDKEMSLPVASFYNVMGYNTKAEVGSATAERVVASSTKAKAHFRLNPANADVKAWDWSMINRTVEVRAAGDANDLLSIASYERSNDELIVSLKSNKSLDETLNPFVNERAIAALQGVNKETNEVITSDYLKVTCEDLTKFSIINPTYLPIKTVQYAREIADLKKENDLQMIYTESIDLNEYVATWAEQVNSDIKPVTLLDEILDEGEVTYQYILPAKYTIGSNNTNQQEFVTLEGSVLKVNTEKWPNLTGAIGGTPIVEVVAVVNDKIINTAIIRVAIVEEAAVEKPVYKVITDPIVLEYNDLVAGKVEGEFTWDQMRKIYDDLKMTREEFNNNYMPGVTSAEHLGVYPQSNADAPVGTQTNAIEVTFDPKYVPSNANGVAVITYKPYNPFKYSTIEITMPYTISHKHESFPGFNPLFVNEETKVAEIRGTMVGTEWEMSTELSEHFLLNGYELEANHERLYAVVRDAERLGAKLGGVNNSEDPEDLQTQVLSFTRPVVNDYVDVPVEIISEKVNGEKNCVLTYTVRFLNHFEITAVTIPTLTENANGTPASGKVTYTVKERFGAKRELVKNSIVNKAVVAEYGLTEDDITATYSEGLNEKGQDWATEFGTNVKGGDKLTLTDNGEGVATITWDNAGSALVSNVNATLKLQVKIGSISSVNKSDNQVVVNKVK